MKHAYPLITTPCNHKTRYGDESAEDEVDEVMQLSAVLKDAWKHYYHPLNYLPLTYGSIESFERTFSALVRASLPYSLLQARLKTFFIANPIHKMDESSTGLEVYLQLLGVGLKEELESIIAEILSNEITKYVEESYTELFYKSVLEYYECWLNKQLLPALSLLFNGADVDGNFREKLSELGKDAIVNLRTREIYQLVSQYSYSKHGIRDLKAGMNRSTQRASVVSVFQQQCQRHLLHGGVDTFHILSMYIQTIKSFTLLEPRGVLLEKVSRPIRRYLREREDTISVIVAGLLGDTSNIPELAAGFKKGGGNSKSESDYVDDLADPNWNPDPLDAPPDFMKEKTADIAGCLISLYENKDIFVKEFVSVFADRLLESDDTINEVKAKLDLLKARFGDQDLQKLDVMINDIDQSLDIDRALHTRKIQGKPVTVKLNAKILSRMYWPTLPESELVLPDAIEKQLKLYSDGYSKIKQGRRLKWLKNVGTVDIELQLEDRNLEFQVTPEQSAVIASFQEGPKSVEDISEAFSMDETKARQMIIFWVGKKVLAKNKNTQKYYVLERESDLDEDDEGNNNLDDVDMVALTREDQKAKEESELYWPFIRGMLTNHGTMPLDRIHTFLKMLVPADQGGYTKTVEELEKFMGYLVNEEKLEENNGGFKLAASK